MKIEKRICTLLLFCLILLLTSCDSIEKATEDNEVSLNSVIDYQDKKGDIYFSDGVTYCFYDDNSFLIMSPVNSSAVSGNYVKTSISANDIDGLVLEGLSAAKLCKNMNMPSIEHYELETVSEMYKGDVIPKRMINIVLAYDDVNSYIYDESWKTITTAFKKEKFDCKDIDKWFYASRGDESKVIEGQSFIMKNNNICYYFFEDGTFYSICNDCTPFTGSSAKNFVKGQYFTREIYLDLLPRGLVGRIKIPNENSRVLMVGCIVDQEYYKNESEKGGYYSLVINKSDSKMYIWDESFGLLDECIGSSMKEQEELEAHFTD